MIITDYKGQHGHDILAGTMNNGAPQHIRKFLDFADSLQVPGLSFTAIHLSLIHISEPTRQP